MRCGRCGGFFVAHGGKGNSVLANVLDEPHGCLARSLRSRIRDKHPCWL